MITCASSFVVVEYHPQDKMWTSGAIAFTDSTISLSDNFQLSDALGALSARVFVVKV